MQVCNAWSFTHILFHEVYQDTFRLYIDLQVQSIIASYKVASLLGDYVEGTRLWMYEHVGNWIDQATTGQTSAANISPNSRMFLLLAGAGMLPKMESC